MPHPRDIRFLPGKGFEIVPKPGEVSVAPISDKKAELVAHWAYIHSQLYKIHLKMSNLYFNYEKYDQSYIQDIFDICVVRFFSFFLSDNIKIRLKPEKIYNENQRLHYTFLKNYRDKFLCHNNFWGLSIDTGVTFNDKGEAREIVSNMAIGYWLDQYQIEAFSRLCLFTYDTIRHQDDRLNQAVIDDINAGKIKLDRDRPFVFETDKLSPWVDRK